MPRNTAKLTDRVRSFSFTSRLKEIDMFFQGKDPVHQSMRRTARRLEKAGIAYAIIGGMALNAHHYGRTTEDVDFLLTADGFEAFRSQFLGKRYEQVPGRPRRFVDRANGITIDILVTGRFPGSGKPGPIAFPDPSAVSEIIDKYSVVNLATLIQLKLAAQRRRLCGCGGADSLQQPRRIFPAEAAPCRSPGLHRMPG